METGEVIAAVLVLVGTGICVFVATYFRLDKRLQRQPRVRIADLAAGQPARITGTVKALDETIEGGVTGRPCVYYRVEIHELRGKGGEPLWRDEEMGVRFAVEDASGTTIVDVRGARTRIPFDARSDEDTFAKPTPRIDALLARLGYANQRVAWKRQHVFIEAALQVGDTVEVMGTPRRARGGDGELELVRTLRPENVKLWVAKVRPNGS